MDKAALIDAVWHAFAGAPRPGREHLVGHECEECHAVRDALAPFAARRLPAYVIQEHFADLSLLSPAALRYYLPAYLARAVEHPDEDVLQFVLFHLSPDDYSSEYWRERLAVFSPEEKSRVCSFLEFFRQSDVYPLFSVEIERGLHVWCRRA